MDYKVLYRKYRPQSFDEVTGQVYVVQTLKNAIINNKISHAYIFTGPRGTGKTSLAKIFAKTINCENPQNGKPCMECFSCKNFKENPDIIEIDAASNNGVDEIRELINNIKLAPSNSKYKVYIIDEVHMLSQSAFNALLLTLEEPPSHVVFILATTDIQNVPITILSRTQRFDFTRIAIEDIIKRLTFVCQKEKIDIEIEALKEIAILSEGGLRDALSILDQVSSQTNEKITVDTVQNVFGTISNSKIKELINYVEKNDVENTLLLLDEFKNSSIDSKIIINKLMNELKNIAINIKLGNLQEKRLTFEVIKKTIIELNESFNKTVGIDPYIILQMILLDNITTIDKKEDSKSKIPEERGNDYFPGNKIAEKTIETAPIEETKQELKTIRVNNCFVNANKKDLEKVKVKWQEFVDKCKELNSDVYMAVCDATAVAASDKYMICQTISESSAGMFNNLLSKIENTYNELFQVEYKMIAISKNEWDAAKAEYINNKNNNIVYKLQSEEVVNNPTNEDTEIDNIVSDVFGNTNIEIEKE